ncbi:hypothetical protein ERJ75_000928900 [Trypanosoma vivax]|nr:hypothetical protein ERJ75_000928900 [Trypanosoma vivax]
MSINLVVDSACNGLLEAVALILNSERNSGSRVAVTGGTNSVPRSVLVLRDGQPHLLLLLITVSDMLLLLRNKCARDYIVAARDIAMAPVYTVIIGNPTKSQQKQLWEGVTHLFVDISLVSILTGVDYASSMEVAGEIVVAHGVKAGKPKSEADPLVRLEGKRKCDPTDFHSLYLSMLSEIASVSTHRAAVIASVFPTMHHLLESIDSGAFERVRVRGYDEERSCSALDPYIAQVLSTDYRDASQEMETNMLLDGSKGFFV